MIGAVVLSVRLLLTLASALCDQSYCTDQSMNYFSIVQLYTTVLSGVYTFLCMSTYYILYCFLLYSMCWYTGITSSSSFLNHHSEEGDLKPELAVTLTMCKTNFLLMFSSIKILYSKHHHCPIVMWHSWQCTMQLVEPTTTLYTAVVTNTLLFSMNIKGACEYRTAMDKTDKKRLDILM